MGQFLILVIVIAILYYLNKGYKSSDWQNINLDKNKKQKLDGSLEDHEAGILVAFLAKVAKADGKVSDIEAKMISHIFSDIANTFEDSKNIRNKLKQIYTNELKTFNNIPKLCQKYLKLNTSYNARISLIQTLLSLAFIDMDFSKEEFMICEDIAKFIKIKNDDFSNLINLFKQSQQKMKNEKTNSLQYAYNILGVSSTSSLSDIKKAYRTLVKKYHPDILRGQGGSIEDIKKANTKLKEINLAYEILKKENKV